MRSFSAIILALFVTASAAQESFSYQNCRNNTFEISGKFFSIRVIARYRDKFPESIAFPERHSGYDIKGRNTYTHFHHTDEIEDAAGNRFYTTYKTKTVYGHIKCFNKRYLMSPYLNDATYAKSKDGQMLFIAVKKGGPLYVFESDKPNVKNNKLVLTTIKEVGPFVTSVSVDRETGDMAIGRREGSGGTVLLIEELYRDPCEIFTDNRLVSPEEDIVSHYKELTVKMGCENKRLMTDSKNLFSTCRQLETLMSKVYERINELSSCCIENNNELMNVPERATRKYLEETTASTVSYIEQCHVENDRITALEVEVDRQKNITNTAQKILQAVMDGSDSIMGLYETEPDGRSVKGNEIDQYSLRNYKCLSDRDWKKAEKDMVTVREQAKYLILGLKIVKNSLGEEKYDMEVEPE